MSESSMMNPRLLEGLQQASSLDLYQLRGMISRMLGDPQRILAVRTLLHTGQAVEFADTRDGRLRKGTVAELRGRDLVIIEDGPRIKWTLPYVAVVPPAERPAPRPAQVPEPTRRIPGRGDFVRGDSVAFEDRHLRTVVGVIVRINAKTATIDTDDGQSWRVAFSHLRRIVDL